MSSLALRSDNGVVGDDGCIAKGVDQKSSRFFQKSGAPFGSPYEKDYSISGSIFCSLLSNSLLSSLQFHHKEFMKILPFWRSEGITVLGPLVYENSHIMGAATTTLYTTPLDYP